MIGYGEKSKNLDGFFNEIAAALQFPYSGSFGKSEPTIEIVLTSGFYA